MCGRIDNHQIPWAFFHLEAPDDASIPVGYNRAPTQTIPVIRLSVEGRREVTPASWDLRPPWRPATQKAPLHNARGETVHQLASFRSAFTARRCIIPANGYYEWRRTDRQPFYFSSADGNPLAFAGIYEASPEGALSACMITTTPNQECAPIHDRMPVILSSINWDRWLAPTALPESDRSDLLIPFRDGGLSIRPVDRSVGSVKNDHPGLIEPVNLPTPESPPAQQGELF